MMDSIKFNDFVRDKGYTLPNNFNYNIGINEIYRFKDSNKKSSNLNLRLIRNNENVYTFMDMASDSKYTYIDTDNQYNSYEKKAYNSQVLQQQKKA